MLRVSNRSSFSVFFFLFVFIAQVGFAKQTHEAQPLSEEQKMEQIRGYFQSEYQEEDFFRTDRLLLTATGSLKPVRLAPAVASVITAEDIEKMGATSLQEVLNTVPGVYISEYFITGIPIYSIRGVHTNLSPQVLIQINGLPVKYTYSGSIPYLLHLPVSIISRIEVIRGPGSAVHGADAFAGIINVITKDSHEIAGTKGGLRYGSFATMEAWLMHGSHYGGWDVMGSIDYFKTDGDDDRIIESDMQQTVFDPLLNAGFGQPPASLTPGPVQSASEDLSLHLAAAKDNWTLGFLGTFKNNAGMGVGLTPILDTYGEHHMDLMLADINYQNDTLLPDGELNARLSYLYMKMDTIGRAFPPGAVLPIDDSDDIIRDGNIEFPPDGDSKYVEFIDGVFGAPIVFDYQPALDLTVLYKGIAEHHLRLGSGVRYIKEKTDNYKNFGPGVIDTDALPPYSQIDGTLTHLENDSPFIFMNNQHRTIWYGSIQDEWSFARHWELTAGVRYDHYSDFGSTTNPRLALVWETMPNLTTKLLYGAAFRPPSFAELYLINNPSALGNPDLKPETIDTLELAFDYEPVGTFRTKFNVFAYEIEDLIELVPDLGGTIMTAQNSRDQEGYGFEFEVDWQIIKTLRLQGNVAYQHSEDKDTGLTVPNAPRWQTYLNAHWDFLPQWSLDAQWFWIADRKRDRDPTLMPPETRPDIDDYSLVNLTVRRTNIANHWDAALLVKNLFDEDIYEPTDPRIPGDYPMEGRGIWGEMRYTF